MKPSATSRVSVCPRLALLGVVGWLLLFTPAPSAEAAEAASPSELRTKIEQVFQELYLATEFEAAEHELLLLIQACDASCARADLASAWMYIGIVRGGGRQDADGAAQAFEQALALDPKVQLDSSVANPDTVAAFVAAGGSASGVAPPAPRPEVVDEPRPEAELRAEAARAGFVCGPQLAELETRRALPVWCETSIAAARATLRYHAFNADDWVSVRMNQVRPGSGKMRRFQAEVPCDASEFAGPLKYFVTVTNDEGGLIATLGNLKEPLVVSVREQVDAPPAAFPGEKPRARCESRETCPPDFPGCIDPAASKVRGDREWGQACSASRECQKGLYCEREGFCDVSRECRVDSDCREGAACVEGLCDATGRAERESSHFSAFGLHFAMDLGPVAGNDVCSTRDTEFDCVATGSGRSYPGELSDEIALEEGEPGEPYPGTSVGGFARGSMRVMLSYDRGVLPKLTVGGRLGVAFNGASSGVDQPAFLPLHLEARASYWLFGNDVQRVQPFVFLGGGLAQVDLQKDLVVRDCSTQPSRSQFQDCINAEGDFESPPENLPEVEVTATRRLGRGFVGAGFGVYVPVYRNLGMLPQVGALLMFPEVGFVLQPSLGAMLAF